MKNARILQNHAMYHPKSSYNSYSWNMHEEMEVIEMAFTFFFRDNQAFDLVMQYAAPDLKTRRYINVWDAGCAMGPEPYTLAIRLREQMGHFLFRNVKICATDIDETNTFGGIIARGIYSDQETKRIPPEILGKFFSPNGSDGCLQISDELRRAVQFQQHDLLSLKPVREGFGLIVCKNVLLHFSPDERVEVIKMFHRTLAEDGYFLTERTQQLPAQTARLFRRVTSVGQLFQKA